MADADAAQLADIGTHIENLVAAIIPLIGIISFVMLIIGSFTILTSAGSDEGLKKGRAIITGAVSGLALSIISWLILLLIENITQVPVTKFNLGL